ncbi:D-inositol 3-phosphate glycosyltransferase [Pelotomaculum schinkii]|uniref:D-inositol 3-phosphate glycosyltransferase n=1 Tax=Pelotomaculum schinkii TaxID=78350 RepID=A0A4Y7R793_9FIRM|nr:glycosyltransferase [Pelotomaculum schinkii]TEB04612.1 D-inositol 3-phosphate glycosyltransferase [Pelotomaculum schinkii]
MRILFILHQFYPEFSGGTEHVALNLANCAQRAGHYVRVLASTVDPVACGGRQSVGFDGAFEIVYHGVPVMLLPHEILPKTTDYSFEPDLDLAERLVAWMRLERFDVAHVLHPMRMGTALLAVQRCGLPYIITLTDFFSACFRINLINVLNEPCPGPNGGVRCAKDCLVAPWTPDSLIGRQRQALSLLTAAGARICPSNYVAECYRSFFPELDFIVIPHGIELMTHTVNTLPSASAEVDDINLTFGFIGSIIPQKGLDTLLRAFASVQCNRLKLRVVGGFYGEPSYQSEVLKLAEADSRVELLGHVTQQKVFEFIREIDVLCLPSRVPETFSMVLHEAIALGVPALVSNLGAPAEHIAKHGDGCILPVDDVAAWSGVITELAENPEVLLAWRSKLPMILRIEEEAFFYESLYRLLLQPN